MIKPPPAQQPKNYSIFSLGISSKVYLGIALACSILTVVQTAHFYFYFEQPFGTSVKWSIKGSIIWALLFVLVAYAKQWQDRLPLSRTSTIAFWVSVAILCGAAQIFFSITMSTLLGTSTRPFWQDFSHLYSKRWLQNLLVFGVFFVWLKSILESKQADLEIRSKTASNSAAKINFQDENGTHLIDVTSINRLESLGNYVCVYTSKQKLIVRRTLKELNTQLAEHGFIRASRSVVVNKERINSCGKNNAGKNILLLSDGVEVAIGRTYLKSVRQALDI